MTDLQIPTTYSLFNYESAFLVKPFVLCFYRDALKRNTHLYCNVKVNFHAWSNAIVVQDSIGSGRAQSIPIRPDLSEEILRGVFMILFRFQSILGMKKEFETSYQNEVTARSILAV